MKEITIFILVIVLFVSCGSSDDGKPKSENLSNEKKAVKVEVVKQSQLINRNVLGGKLNLLLPDYFELMSPRLVEIKYPSGNRPSEIYSDKTGGISIGFSHTENAMQIEQLPELLPVFVQQFSTLYPAIKWHKKELVKIQGIGCVLLEFETPAVDTEIYNLMAVTVLEEKMLISTFNCTVQSKSEWKGKATQIINSIQILK
jgi:hypothetical protein